MKTKISHLLILLCSTLLIAACGGSDIEPEGTLTFWTAIPNEGTITVTVQIDGENETDIITGFYLTDPSCGALYAASFEYLSHGTYSYIARSQAGSVWEGVVEVDGRCNLYELY